MPQPQLTVVGRRIETSEAATITPPVAMPSPAKARATFLARVKATYTALVAEAVGSGMLADRIVAKTWPYLSNTLGESHRSGVAQGAAGKLRPKALAQAAPPAVPARPRGRAVGVKARWRSLGLTK